MADHPRVSSKVWDPEAKLADLMLEAQVDDFDAAASVSRLLRENALVAAESIAHPSAHAHNERVRFQASQYIIDRVLGGGFEADLKLQQLQINLVGKALYSVVRALGLRFDFDPDDPVVKGIAQETMLMLAESSDSDH